MTSSPATASSDLVLIDSTMLPAFTHGDTSSVIFGISKGNSISRLRTDKAKLDSGEISSCEGCFTVKFMTGEPQHTICGNSVCEMHLRIDLIDDTDCGLQISGTVISVAYGRQFGGYLTGSFSLNGPISADMAAELNLLHEGTRIKLIHRGAASAGAITYIHDPVSNRIHIPHIPTDVTTPLESAGNKKPSGISTRGGNFAVYRGGRRRTIPYRY